MSSYAGPVACASVIAEIRYQLPSDVVLSAETLASEAPPPSTCHEKKKKLHWEAIGQYSWVHSCCTHHWARNLGSHVSFGLVTQAYRNRFTAYVPRIDQIEVAEGYPLSCMFTKANPC